jgi:diguanylate cyclase (GGDEF)-like protein
MTNDGFRGIIPAMAKALRSVEGVIILLGILALVIGLFIGSTVGKILCGIILLGAAATVVIRRRDILRALKSESPAAGASDRSPIPEGNMKKLLFDDYQPPKDGKYVVKEVHEEDTVVPSSRRVQPATFAGMEGERVREFAVGDFFDLETDAFGSEGEPRGEFNFLLRKVLMGVKEVLFAHSVAYFWANHEKQQLVLEAAHSDGIAFTASKRTPMGNDIVSRVAVSGTPEVLGRITASSEIEFFAYREPEGIQSAVVVPVYFNGHDVRRRPVGVIVADSKAEDAFGDETISMLGTFTKLVAALVKSYTEKYDLLLDSELLNSIRRMHDRVKSSPAEETLLAAVAEEANRLANWDFLAVTLYNDDRRAWEIQRVTNKPGQPYVETGLAIDFAGSAVGKAIRSNTVEVISDLSAGGQARFSDDEPSVHAGAFVALPISSLNRCYGAVSVESRNRENFSGVEVETLYRLVENAAALLEIIYLDELVKDYVIVDQLTGSFTRKHFLKTVEEEVRRAEDFGSELALVSLAVDGMEELVQRYSREGFDHVLHEVVSLVRLNIRSYDIIGREGPDRIGILLINTAASDAYLWGEKMRKLVAGHVVTLGGKSFSVTVSVGICGLLEGMKKEELLAGTSQVLSKAMEKGGNLVRVY